MNPIPTVGVLIFKDYTILLVQHGERGGHVSGTYGLPAGKFEQNETAKQAAIRELEEETGLKTTENDLIELPIHIPPADLLRKDGTTKRFTITLFYCKKYTGSLRSSDETTPQWIPVVEADKLALEGFTYKMIQEGFELSKQYA
jgi:ADP-ribose pyrophosphatase YjhB (NUDIX family)